MSSAPHAPTRFVGLDVHKASIVVAAVDQEQQIVVRPRRFSVTAFLEWAVRHLTPTDAVVLEATTNAWPLFDHLHPLVASVTVAHPVLVKWITAARVKTDPRATVHLARLRAAGLIPPVWVPPPEVRDLRTVVAHRQRLVQQRTRMRTHRACHPARAHPAWSCWEDVRPPAGNLVAGTPAPGSRAPAGAARTGAPGQPGDAHR